MRVQARKYEVDIYGKVWGKKNVGEVHDNIDDALFDLERGVRLAVKEFKPQFKSVTLDEDLDNLSIIIKEDREKSVYYLAFLKDKPNEKWICPLDHITVDRDRCPKCKFTKEEAEEEVEYQNDLYNNYDEMEQMYEDEGNNTFYPCSYYREEPDDCDYDY